MKKVITVTPPPPEKPLTGGRKCAPLPLTCWEWVNGAKYWRLNGELHHDEKVRDWVRRNCAEPWNKTGLFLWHMQLEAYAEHHKRLP